MRNVRTVLLALVVAATGVYFVLYLYGWEWYRAFVVGIVFLAAEIAAVGARLSTLLHDLAAGDRPAATTGPAPGVVGRSRRAGHPSPAAEQVVAEVLSSTDPRYPDTFRWLQPGEGRTGVFIPLLLGAGVLLSGTAWIMEHLAGAIYGGRIDAALARTAAPLIPPDDLLDTPTSQALLSVPGHWGDPQVGG